MAYQPQDYLSLAREAEAQGNAYDASKHYQQVQQQNPESREAAFFILCYDTMNAGSREVTANCSAVTEAYNAAAEEISASQNMDVLEAMSGRVTDLAGRWLRAVDYDQEHYKSTVPEDRKRMQLMSGKRREACVGMLRHVEDTLSGLEGAEDLLLRFRKRMLDELGSHPDALPKAEQRRETLRLARLIREREPEAQVDVPTVSALGARKFWLMGGLLGASALIVFVDLHFVLKSSLVALFTGGATMIIDALLFYSVRKRDEDDRNLALSFATIATAVQALMLAITLVLRARDGTLSGISLLNRGVFNLTEVLIGGLAIVYALKGPFRSSWPSFVMIAVAVSFLVINLVNWNQGWMRIHNSVTAWADGISQEERQALEGVQFVVDDNQQVIPATEEQVTASVQGTGSVYLFGFYDGDLCLLQNISSDSSSQIAGTESGQDASAGDLNEEGTETAGRSGVLINVVNEDSAHQLQRTNFILSLISVVAFDLGCAAGFVYPYAKSRKKRAA